ncbi:vWA domain-containing protein [Cerasicoccus fimbriatus]|uniref:vWA domain-containing protein n=1 Tax=Cerasicoccus fimbriatus TaxID=3014554 RepID=UPI0022B4AF0A|nr:VWA domain-containing protein [Cerasicoccus sp. TK19100]
MLAFGAPAFLWALAALAAPVIVHLINRERAVVLKFPSVRYIDQSRLPQEGRRRLRDWLLLLLRLMVYAMVILALANPRWIDTTDATAPVEPEAPVTMMVLDASASMSHRTTFNNLTEALDQYIDGQPVGTEIGLVVYDDQVRVALAPTTDRAAVKDAWRESSPSFDRAGKPSLGVAEAVRLLNDRAGEVLVFSDFQSSDWQQVGAPRLPEGSTLELVSVRPDPWQNVSIQWARGFPKRDGSLRIFARVRNDNAEPVPVRLSMALPAVEKEVTLKPNTAELIALDVPKADNPGGPQAAELQLAVITEESHPESNLYSADDTYHFWLGEPAATVVGALIPLDTEPGKMREASFISRALGVGDDSTSGQFDFVPVSGEDPNWMDQMDAIYLPGTGAYFDQPAWARMKEFVEQGGVLFITPGKNAPRMFRGMRESGISNTAYVGKPRRARNEASAYRIGELPADGALAKVFDEDAREDLYLTDIYEHWQVKAGAGAEVLLQSETGSPLLIRERLGKGAVVVSALEFDPAATDLPLRNSFVPVLWETLGESINTGDNDLSISVGESVPNDLLTGAAGGEFDTSQPGVILVDGQALEVNIAREESAAQGAILSDVRARLLGQRTGPQQATTTLDSAEPGAPLWPWLAVLALLACIFETALTARMENATEATA